MYIIIYIYIYTYTHVHIHIWCTLYIYIHTHTIVIVFHLPAFRDASSHHAPTVFSGVATCFNNHSNNSSTKQQRY